jgi:tripartite-type tricarboxylate transporter receptor subunit TctC
MSLSAMLGSAESTPIRRQRSDARKTQVEVPIIQGRLKARSREQDPMGTGLRTSVFLWCALALHAVNPAHAQDGDVARYPQRPINLVVAFSPGGTVDLAFRLVAREVERVLGQPVVVVNKAGGGGNVAVAAVASAKPDGYTVGQVPGQTIFVMPFLEKLQYNPAKDLTFIAQFAEASFAIVVRKDSPYTSLKDLVA